MIDADVHRSLSELRVLMVGLGSIGRRHAGNLKRLGAKRVSAYRTGLGSLPIDPALDDVRLFTTLDDALAAKPDIVFVTNPSSLHLEVARAAVAAGCHVFIEKPIATGLDGVEDLLAAADASGVRVGIGYDMRFNRALQALRRELAAGALGPIVSAQVEVGSYLPAWHSWEDYRVSYAARAALGGGVLLTLSHEIDLARWLLGEVDSVSAEIAKLSDLEIDVEDVSVLLLRFRSGAVATIYLDFVQRPVQRRCRVVGQRGALEWNEATGTAELVRSGARTIVGTADADSNAPFVDELRDFLRGVVTGEPGAMIASGQDGERVLAIITAAREAAQTGRRVSVIESVSQTGVN
jgi:predicted dehydrogenase